LATIVHQWRWWTRTARPGNAWRQVVERQRHERDHGSSVSSIRSSRSALDGDTVVFGVPKDLFLAGTAYVFRLIPDDVSATSVSGTLLLCLVMLGTGPYFVRR
jgi:hypothetical protein